MSFKFETKSDFLESDTPFYSNGRLCEFGTECSKSAHSFEYRIPQKAVVLQMEDLNNLKNSVSNALIKAMPKCDNTTIKIFELIISAINPKDPPSDFIVYIEKKMLYKFLNLNSSTRGRDLEKKLIKFRNELYFNFSVLKDEERKKVNEAIEKENSIVVDKKFKLQPIHKNHIVSAANEIFWEAYNPYVGFQLTHRIMFFLSNLGEGKQYTQYELIGISKFESKYSVILYRWLKMKYQQFKYNLKENHVKNKIEISIDDLRELTDTTDLYKRFDHFEERVLKVPQNEINNFSVIYFEYKKIKKGRNIESIQFFVKDNVLNIPKKEEKLTPRKSKKEKEEERDAIAFKAIVSPYTKMLENRMLLQKDYQNDAHMLVRLYEDLYPIYDEIVDNHGKSTLISHLDRICDATFEKDINDTVSYLVSCAKNAIENDFRHEKKYSRKK